MGAFLLLLGDLPGISCSARTTPVLPSLHFSRFPHHSICLSLPLMSSPGSLGHVSPRRSRLTLQQMHVCSFPFKTIGSYVGFFKGGGVINHCFIAASTVRRSQQDDSILSFINDEKVLLTLMF